MNRVSSLRGRMGVFVCTAVACGLMAGCGGSSAAKTYSVNGKVTYPDGSPVSGAGVAYIGKEYTANGTTGEDGTFTLTTFEDGDGAPAGEYEVVVELYDEGDVNLLDAKYAEGATSGLTAKVSMSGDNHSEFKVEKASGAGAAPGSGA